MQTRAGGMLSRAARGCDAEPSLARERQRGMPGLVARTLSLNLESVR